VKLGDVSLAHIMQSVVLGQCCELELVSDVSEMVLSVCA
jgi:hypothetical protein